MLYVEKGFYYMKNKRFSKAVKFPNNFKPMLATLVDTPPTDANWIFEIKIDGYRAMSFCNGNNVNIQSRNNKSFNEKFYPILDGLKKLNLCAVLDGEIAVLDEMGMPSFEKLQDWRSEADGVLVYYVFDIIWLNGKDLTQKPLIERKKLLKKSVPKEGNIKCSVFFTADAEKILKDAKKNELEGIIAKRSDSLYFPGSRRKEWLKIKVNKRHEVVIGGFTKNEDTPKFFSALLVGVYENNGLQYIGKVGTGFNQVFQKKLIEKCKNLITAQCPFTHVPDINKPSRFNPNPPKAKVTWLKPKLVCEISYIEMSSDGIIRHPSFKGLREDKKAKDVHGEITEKQDQTNNLIIKFTPPKKGERQTLLNPKEDTQVKNFNNRIIKFNHLNKVYWPKLGFTKRDLLNYYYQIAPYILPYLINRPQTLNRFPNGVKGKSFYQKDITKIAPNWLMQYPYRTSLNEDKNYLVIQNEEDFYWMVNLGVIEINPWSSNIETPDNPTWCIMDIDPSSANTFEQVIAVANITKKILDELNIKSYCKTSGSSGLHIYFPLNNKYTYAQSQLLGRKIAAEVNKRSLKITSIERYSVNRKKKIYVDFLQNRPKATVAAPYSVRPTMSATVSMPLHWEEVKKGLSPEKFTLKNSIDRVKSEGDIFKPVLGRGINLPKILKILGD